MMDESNLQWTTLDSRYLFKDSWLKARVDSCLRPDGKVVEPYYVLEYPPFVCGLCITKERRVVMVKQYRHALGEVSVELPGGCVDAGETPADAMMREAREETGYVFESCVALGSTSPNPSTNNNLMHMFLLEGGELKHAQQLDANEQIVVEEYSLDELFEMVLGGEIVQAMHVTAIFYAFKKLGFLSVRLGE